jgi:hypothetical protein
VLFSESASAGAATTEDCDEWNDADPNPAIPVLADSELKVHDWIGVVSYPVLNLVDSDMRLQVHMTTGPSAARQALHEESRLVQ